MAKKKPHRKSKAAGDRLRAAGKRQEEKRKAAAPPAEAEVAGKAAAPPAEAEPTVEVSAEEARADREKKEKDEAARKTEAERIKKLGLVEVPVKGTTLSLLGLPDPFKTPPTMAQRKAMADRLIEIAPMLPHYISRYVDAEKPGKSVQGIVDHAVEFGGEMGNKNSVIPKETQQKMDKVFKGALSVIAKHDPESGAAALLSGKKMKKKPDLKLVKTEKGKVEPKTKVKETKKAKNMTPAKVPQGGFNKSNRPATSGELIRARIVEHKLTDEQIAAETRKLFEGRNTQVSDVRWNRGQMLKAGVSAPDPVGGDPPPKTKTKTKTGKKK